ncbi:TonB-dependent receptor domain-containing protein [Rufibacter glacialis]|uniref:TonB-dependent receptor domain-containing protein n=2 Tax=Rufibacter glacialis TaxID=1259555 RepID=A0ABV4RJW9_9BACT|nr:TonB-dependent receptor [Rufibacter glacialis]GGK88955.1 TonB-dependent receptor [Rufibacter glacialis]
MFFYRIFLCLGLLFSVGNAMAQSNNSLSGTISDEQTKTPLIGAILYLTDLKRAVTTDAEGHYSLQDLPRGRFLAEIRYIGYVTKAQSITINGATTANFTLAPSVTEIRAVVVTGVSSSTESRLNPVPTTVVGREELERGAATNIIDAIAKTPGVAQISTGAGISKPVIRGLGFNRIITLNDGIKQEGQQWGDEHGIEIDEYSIDRAEIVKGPGSLMYGSDGIAGVINFLTPDPIAEGKVIGNLSTNYQSNNNLLGYSAYNAGNLNGFNWAARLSQKVAGNYRNDYDGRVYNSGFRETNANGYVGLNKSWGYSHLAFSTFNQTVGLVEGERDEEGNFLKLVNHNGEAEEETATGEDLTGYGIGIPQQRINHLRVASQNNLVFEKSRLTFNLAWQQNLRREYGNPVDTQEEELAMRLRTFNYDVKYFLPNWGSWEPTVGVNGMVQQNRNEGEEVIIPEYRLWDAGVFAFLKREFGPLHLSGGLRYDYREIASDALFMTDEDEFTTDPALAEETKFNGFNTSFANISGSVGATYSLSEKLTVKANLARGFRSPNIAELASNGRHEGTFRYEVGNSDLKAETSLQADAGLTYDSKHVTLGVNGFRNNIQNYIFAQKLTNVLGGDSLSGEEDDLAPTFKYVQGDAYVYGGEFVLDIHPHPLDWLHLENTFSWVRSIQKHVPQDMKYLPFTPAPRLDTELRVSFPKAGTYIRNWYAKAEVENYFAQNKVYSAFGTETPTPGYTLLNLGIGGNLTNAQGKTRLSVYLTANNVLDKAYQSHLSRLKYAPENPATGRTGVYNMGRNISLKVIVPVG